MALARLDGASVPYATALAIAVHASVVLALQQIVATPLHYVRESLTSPTNLAGHAADVRRRHVAGAVARVDRCVRAVVGVAAGLGLAAGDRRRPARRISWRLLAVVCRRRGDRGGGVRRAAVRSRDSRRELRVSQEVVLVVVVLLVVGGGAAARTSRAGATRASRSPPKPSRSATSKRSSRPRARSIRRRRSTSAPSRWAASRASACKEGDRVKAGQFLLQIDPVNAEAAVRRDEAAVAGARTGARAVTASAAERARQPRRARARRSSASRSCRRPA